MSLSLFLNLSLSSGLVLPARDKVKPARTRAGLSRLEPEPHLGRPLAESPHRAGLAPSLVRMTKFESSAKSFGLFGPEGPVGGPRLVPVTNIVFYEGPYLTNIRLIRRSITRARRRKKMPCFKNMFISVLVKGVHRERDIAVAADESSASSPGG